MMEFGNDIDLPQFGLGTDFMEDGHRVFPTSSPISYVDDRHGVLDPLRPSVPPGPFGQVFTPSHGCVPQCSDEQLREFGYIRRIVGYQPHPKTLQQINQPEPGPDYTAKITIRCLEPPPVQPPRKLTVTEIRPPAPPAPRPIVDPGQRPLPPPTPPPLILRQQPPLPPPAGSDQTCHVYLPRPPAPPAQRIIHRWQPLPPKPRDIIIERWLPYKYLFKPELKVIPAPAYVPEPVRDVIITHIPQKPRINHRIEKEPTRHEDPETYRRKYRSDLLLEEEIKRRVFQELSEQHANEDILRSLQAIFRVPCNQNHESIASNDSNINGVINNQLPRQEPCEERLRRAEAELQALRNQNHESIGFGEFNPNILNNNVFQQPLEQSY